MRGDGHQTKPNHQSLALVRANLSYVELGQWIQVHGSDAARPFLSEIYSVLSRQYQKMTLASYTVN